MEPQRDQSGRADFQAPLRRANFVQLANESSSNVSEQLPPHEPPVLQPTPPENATAFTASTVQQTPIIGMSEPLELSNLAQPATHLATKPLVSSVATTKPITEPELPSKKRLIVSLALSAMVILVVIGFGIALYRGQHHAPDATIGRPGAVSSDTNSANASNVTGSAQDKSDNALRQANLTSIQTNVEAYYTQKGLYPTVTEMTSLSWVKANLKNLDPDALKDPEGGTASLVSSPAKNTFSYQAGIDTSLAACDNVQINCNYYKLTAILSDGSQLVKDAKQ